MHWAVVGASSIAADVMINGLRRVADGKSDRSVSSAAGQARGVMILQPVGDAATSGTGACLNHGGF